MENKLLRNLKKLLYSKWKHFHQYFDKDSKLSSPKYWWNCVHFSGMQQLGYKTLCSN